MFPRSSASLVKISSGFSPQAVMISLSCIILFACVVGLMTNPADEYMFLNAWSWSSGAV